MITLIKTTGGIEIAGEVLFEDDGVILLRRPLQINYRYFVGALPAVSVNRYMMFSEDDTVEIYKTQIVARTSARKPFEHFYNQSVERHYLIAQQAVDMELSAAEEEPKTFASKDEYREHLKKLLEEMPVEGSTVN